jgi:hypothetical protein
VVLLDEKKSFLLYTEYFEQIEMLSIEQRGILLTAIMAYQLEKDLPEMDAMTRMCYSFISADMRRNNEKYARIVERRREAGQKGGRIAQANRANQANQANATFAQANQANQADNVNVNENDNDNENVNVNVSVNENAPSGYSGKDTTTQSETQTTTGVWPTIGTIKTYCAEQGIETDVAKFYQYNLKRRFDRDWKEALTLWVGHDRQDPEPKKKPNSFNDNFPARKYDYDELEKRLLQVKGT